jgi:leucyl aminopeptidase
VLGVYSFDKYFTENKPGRKLAKIQILVEDSASFDRAKKGVAAGEAVTNGVTLARDLANAPSNEIYPESLAARAKELSAQGVKVTVLNKGQIEKLGMGGLLAVNQGSVRPPFFVIMEWNGGKKGESPIVLVGKGITFDTGGISIKPAGGMGEMKMDMGGAAAVIGAMRSIAELKVGRNVIGLVPTTENMPSGSAYKPGDVVTFMNGKTAEIDNTDAEGRLILADALTYADRYKPQAVIDLATLTGACVVALGNVATGLMGNNADLNRKLVEAGNRTYDRVVELPLWEEYEELIKSDIADVKNSGGRGAGTITAALFLQHFIGNYAWAHLDIAGTGMIPKGFAYLSKGGTGAGVRLLVDMVRNWSNG